MPAGKHTYTVIGIYSEPFGQRYATTVEADSPEDAEIEARCQLGDEGTDLIVAGVIEGEHQMVDVER